MANKNKQWCFAWVAKPAAPGTNRAALLKGVKWKPGDSITVSFLDGDPAVQQRVKAAAQEWVAPGLANLKLVFQNKTDTLIRISFKYQGSWSVLGTTCKQITDKAQPTMNYGWLDAASTDAEVRSVVLHEFGHALGLVHEHQNPGGVIHWNREQIINDLSGYPNHWDLDTIELNMFHTYAQAETNFSKLDPKSIMMYPIPKEWTTDGLTVGSNTELSKTDKDFIKKEYP